MSELLKLVRVATSDKGTFGVLVRDNRPLCTTCEDPWRNNERNVSCIPEGTYTCIKRSSPKYGKHWHIQDVPNRSLILIHNGNTISHTEGCVLVGRGFFSTGDLPMITDSHATMGLLRANLPASFELQIINAF